MKGGEMSEPRVKFSVEYWNPEYPDEIWAADWDLCKQKAWSISRSPDYKIAWEVVKNEIDGQAYLAVLEKFGLLEWKKEYPLRLVGKFSPAELALRRREKEKEYNLPYLEIISDNIDAEAEKGQILHHAEDYK